MKKSIKFATALAGAAVVVAGGTAFTNSNSGMPGATFYGYQETTVSGVVVAKSTITRNAADPGLIDEVKFWEAVGATRNPANYTATLTTDTGGTSDDWSCTIGYTGSATPDGQNTYTCATTGNGGLTVEEFKIIGFEVVQNNLPTGS